MRRGVAGVAALVLLLLSACTSLGNPDQTKACRALADQVPGIPGVAKAGFTDAIVSSLPRCSGVVDLAPGLTTAQKGQIVGSVYDVVRTRGVKEVEFSTVFTQAGFTVASGFPTTAQATGVLGIAEKAHADSAEVAWSLASGLVASVHAPLTATSPAGSLREGAALLQLEPPSGIREVHWFLGGTRIVSPTIAADGAARLEAVASWLDRNPGVTSYSFRDESGVQTWALVTTTEAPDEIRDFATVAGSSATVMVSGALAGKTPYLTLP